MKNNTTGKKETRQVNQVLNKAVKEQREEGGPGKQPDARSAPTAHSPRKQSGR